MPTRTNERGICEVISNEHARGLAKDNMDQVEALQRRHDQFGYLTQRDQERMLACFNEAEALLKQTGDAKDRPMGPYGTRVFHTPFVPQEQFGADDEPKPAKGTREQARERAQAVLNVYRKITAGAVETKAVDSEQKTVNMKLDYGLGLYIVSGCGRTVQYASREAAEHECRRRVGLG